MILYDFLRVYLLTLSFNEWKFMFVNWANIIKLCELFSLNNLIKFNFWFFEKE